MFNKKKSFPKLTDRALEFLKMAQARDRSVNTENCKCSGKDGKAFYFLMGFWIGKTS